MAKKPPESKSLVSEDSKGPPEIVARKKFMFLLNFFPEQKKAFYACDGDWRKLSAGDNFFIGALYKIAKNVGTFPRNAEVYSIFSGILKKVFPDAKEALEASDGNLDELPSSQVEVLRITRTVAEKLAGTKQIAASSKDSIAPIREKVHRGATQADMTKPERVEIIPSEEDSGRTFQRIDQYPEAQIIDVQFSDPVVIAGIVGDFWDKDHTLTLDIQKMFFMGLTDDEIKRFETRLTPDRFNLEGVCTFYKVAEERVEMSSQRNSEQTKKDVKYLFNIFGPYLRSIISLSLQSAVAEKAKIDRGVPKPGWYNDHIAAGLFRSQRARRKKSDRRAVSGELGRLDKEVGQWRNIKQRVEDAINSFKSYLGDRLIEDIDDLSDKKEEKNINEYIYSRLSSLYNELSILYRSLPGKVNYYDLANFLCYGNNTVERETFTKNMQILNKRILDQLGVLAEDAKEHSASHRELIRFIEDVQRGNYKFYDNSWLNQYNEINSIQHRVAHTNIYDLRVGLYGLLSTYKKRFGGKKPKKEVVERLKRKKTDEYLGSIEEE